MEASGSESKRLRCFVDEDDGLASIIDMEAESSVNQLLNKPFFSRSLCYGKISVNSPRSTPPFDAKFEDDYNHEPHYLEFCTLCRKPLGDRDIYMYKGNVPFCSEECRQEGIDKDEAEEKMMRMKALKNKKGQRKSSVSPTKSEGYPSRTGTVAAG